MNSVNIMGNLCKDTALEYSASGNAYLRNSIAVRRDKDTTDFFSITAFGKGAEFIEKYFHKGMKMDLTGRIQTGSYTKEDGTKVYTTDVVAESVEFGESKGGQQASQPKQDSDGFMKIPEDAGDSLPFV